MRIVDLFAGMGGWSEGLRLLGVSDVGLELDATACATREAAGHDTIRADVAAYPAERFAGYDGLIASPPCTDWSQAGNRLQRGGRTGDLVDQVPRWVKAVRPRWVACEQVPPALGVWQDFARLFASWGYSTWAGLLSAERYGVPQTRERAVLLARLDGVAHPPVPTHQRYEAGVAQGAADECQPSLLGPGVEPWVSMADALGWGYDESPSRVICGNRLPRWLYEDGDGSHGRVLHTNRDQREDGSRQQVPSSRPAPAVTTMGNRWWWQRPATTVCADPRLWPPGHKRNGADEVRLGADEASRRYGDRAGTQAQRLTVEQALVLQSFRSDYPVQGGKTAAFEQVGNAVPPLLARAVIGALVDSPLTVY